MKPDISMPAMTDAAPPLTVHIPVTPETLSSFAVGDVVKVTIHGKIASMHMAKEDGEVTLELSEDATPNEFEEMSSESEGD